MEEKNEPPAAALPVWERGEVAAPPQHREPRRQVRLVLAQRHLDAAPGALPNCYQIELRLERPEKSSSRKSLTCGYFCLARATGLEPATTGSTVRHFNRKILEKTHVLG